MRGSASHAGGVFGACETLAIDVLEQRPITPAHGRGLFPHLLALGDAFRIAMQSKAGRDLVDVFDVEVLERSDQVVVIERVVQRGVYLADGLDHRAPPEQSWIVPERSAL